MFFAWKAVLNSNIKSEKIALEFERQRLLIELESIIVLQFDFVPSDTKKELYYIMIIAIESANSYEQLEKAVNKCNEVLYYLIEKDNEYKRKYENNNTSNTDMNIYTVEELKALKVLNLSANISKDNIKKQYKKLVKQCHPDLGGDKDTFIKIQNAYDILKTSYNIK